MCKAALILSVGAMVVHVAMNLLTEIIMLVAKYTMHVLYMSIMG